MSLADQHPDHLPRSGAWSRRELLRSAAILGAGSGLGWMGLHARASTPMVRRDDGQSARGPAKNLIFMVSDGMSLGTLSLGEKILRRRHGRQGWWSTLWEMPGVRRALQDTSALDSLVTDSAAAASAWGGGKRVNIGSINVSPDGTQQLPLFVQAKQAGKLVGAVTTTRITHATPAGFYSNCPRRDHEGVIARDLLERGVDVAMGGGERFFPEWTLKQHPDVRVVRNKSELQAAPLDGRLLGLFHQTHVPFVLDREAGVPSLTDMTSAALIRLEKAPNGFLLQVEGGRVDHAAHNNDASCLVQEQIEFDESLGAVLAWMKGRDDTLLIVTTDHGNANPGLTLYLNEGSAGLDRLSSARRSFDWISDTLRDQPGAEARMERLPAIVQDATGVRLDDGSLDLLRRTMRDERVAPFRTANKWPNVLGAILADSFGVAFVSPNHTADLVEFTAIGPGSERLPGVIANNQVHDLMVTALGLPAGQLLPDMIQPAAPVGRPAPD